MKLFLYDQRQTQRNERYYISLSILEILHDSQDIFIISSIKYLLHAFFLKHVGIFYVHQHDRRKIVFHYVLTGNELSSNTLPNTIR